MHGSAHVPHVVSKLIMGALATDSLGSRLAWTCASTTRDFDGLQAMFFKNVGHGLAMVLTSCGMIVCTKY